ncbi:CopD family protein [Paludibacterium purpuratum]|uniref:Protoporphyrinogen IX oxidase n=1 Tax=Paludibacterium purpuratum TaxID=1144873 RepID=A0A4V3DUE2_9NEIS|nr:CopD family protein [Paludibacterium purpuratum]TDR72477.1 putative membrane protein [Paludibacterium purpuratum]
MGYLYIKAFHIFFVTSWFAGLFYLPRLFVNLAMAKPGDESQRLLEMARKLYRFMMPLSLMSIVFGLWLWLGYGIAGGWLHAKLALVMLLLGFQYYCGRIYRDFEAGRNQRSHVWYRVFNEIPTFILLAIVILVVVKPF